MIDFITENKRPSQPGLLITMVVPLPAASFLPRPESLTADSDRKCVFVCLCRFISDSDSNETEDETDIKPMTDNAI